MRVPLQVTFENIEHSDAIEARINDDWKKLEPFSDGIISARVVVGRPQRRHHKGDSYQVRIHLTVASGTEIVINRDPDVTDAHDDVYVTIRDAFKAAVGSFRTSRASDTSPVGTAALKVCSGPEADTDNLGSD